MTTATAGTTSLRLYDIPDRLREIEDTIIEAGGEITQETEAELDALEGAFERKAEYIGLLAQEAKAEAAAVKMEEDRLRNRRTAAENRERYWKSYLQASLTKAGLRKIEGERVKIGLRQNTRPSIRWTLDLEKLPEPYIRVAVSVDGDAAYRTWKEGGTLPDGFIVELGEHVRVW